MARKHGTWPGQKVRSPRRTASCGAVMLALLALCAVSASADIIRVPGDVGSIQEALNQAAPFDTVLVDHGTYFENILWPSTEGLKLYANEQAPPESTVIDGGFTYAPVIRLETGVTASTEIRRFVIENGMADNGAGILCSAGASPTITLNDISHNVAAGCGGGICCISASPAILSNTFASDSAGSGGAVAVIGRSAPLVQDNFIHDCSAGYGGGIYSEDGSSIVLNTIFACTGTGAAMYLGGSCVADHNYMTGNFGRAVYCAGDITLTACEIMGSSGGGIYVAPGSVPLIEGNIIDGNVAAAGAGIFSDHAYPTIRGNKIRHNDVGPGIGGGLSIEYGAALVERNEITYNSTTYEAAGIYACGDSSFIAYNNISYNQCPHASTGGGVFT